ncbi:MAG: hypothetical protein HFJ09_09950 [Lachnospiraceae bacterium]|nr:hypothetical protein [Lachnospiraceae bacterium]
MHKNKKTLKHRLKKLRMIMYTTVSLIVIETSGIFSLAKNGILYIYSNAVTNAFAPATYVDIEINEPNGDTYYIKDEKILTEDGKSKEAYIANPGTAIAKKPVLVRARVIAVVHDQDGIALGVTQDFTLQQDSAIWTGKDSDGYYYYKKALEPGAEQVPIFTDVTFTNISNIPEKGYVALHVIADTIEVDMAGTDAAKEKNKNNIITNWKKLPSDIWTEYFPT